MTRLGKKYPAEITARQKLIMGELEIISWHLQINPKWDYLRIQESNRVIKEKMFINLYTYSNNEEETKK